MATSIYIYESLKEYNKIYGMERGDEMRETQLIDMYVREGKLFVVTNTSLHKEQPSLETIIGGGVIITTIAIHSALALKK